jgi:hypothetical protein
MPDLSHVNWVLLAVVGIALAIGWTFLRIVLRLTIRMFSMGCIGLLLLGGIVAAVAYFSSR